VKTSLVRLLNHHQQQSRLTPPVVAVNLSRELLQDSALVGKIGRVLTGRIIKFLQQQLAEDRKAYETFYNEFSKQHVLYCVVSWCCQPASNSVE
jgi:hypothetical protein